MMTHDRFELTVPSSVLALRYHGTKGLSNPKESAMLTQEAKDLFSRLNCEFQPVAIKYCYS